MLHDLKLGRRKIELCHLRLIFFHVDRLSVLYGTVTKARPGPNNRKMNNKYECVCVWMLQDIILVVLEVLFTEQEGNEHI